MKQPTTLSYMPYLDGIRAIAVTGVVVFHLGIKSIHGGFTGVDTFFVLSGFLITLIIGRQQAAGKFSFVDFYVRRGRRLLPALFAVIIATLIGSFLLLTPDHFHDTARSSIYAALSAANINFWLNAGYFDSSKYASPLLHTWSLGVEEQFYLVWPAILIVLMKFRSRILLILGLTALGALSFWGMLACQETLPNGVFYLSPFRAWQFAIGAILALLWDWKGNIGERFIHPIVDMLLTVVGIAALVYAFIVTDSSGYPGLASVLPTVATLLIVMGGTNLLSRIILTNPVSIFLGKTSYSIYLWHWPVIVFMRYYNGYSNDLTLPMIIVAAAVSVLLGTLSFYFLETPLRHPWNEDRTKDRLAVPAGLSVVAILLVVLSSHIWAQDGWRWRLSSELTETLTALEEEKAPNCVNTKNGKPKKQVCLIGVNKSDPDFILVGDSHGQALSHGIAVYAKQSRRSGDLILNNGFLPFEGIENVQGKKLQGNQLWDRFAERLSTSDASLVIMHARFALHWNSVRARGETGPERLVGLPGEMPASIEESQQNFRDALDRTLDVLEASGKKVIIVGSVPHPGVNIRQCSTRPTIIMSPAQVIATCRGYSREESIARAAAVNAVLKEAVEARGFVFIDPTDYLCPEGQPTCLREVNGELVYMDDDHLSAYGAQIIAEPIWEEAQKLLKGR